MLMTVDEVDDDDSTDLRTGCSRSGTYGVEIIKI